MRNLVRSILAASLLAVLLAPRPSAAVDIRLEVAPLVAIPLSPLLDGVPIEVGDVELVPGAAPTDVVVLFDATQKTGFGLSFSLLLDSWEIRYEFASLGFDRAEFRHWNFPEYTGDIYIPSKVIEDALEAAGYGDLSFSADISGSQSLLLHTIGFGYRFTPYDWVVHPYFPLSLGFAIAQQRNGGEAMYGFNVQIGAGVEWDPIEALRVGLALRYSFSAYKNPDTTIATITQTGIQSGATNQSLFEAVMETIDLITISAHISYRF